MTFIVPLLAVLLLPWTTLMYVLVWQPATGVSGFGWFLLGLGFVGAAGQDVLNAWAGYGAPPRRERRRNAPPAAPVEPPGPPPTLTWSKASGPGVVTFADPTAPMTTATFSAPGEVRSHADGRQRAIEGFVFAARNRRASAAVCRPRAGGDLVPPDRQPLLEPAREDDEITNWIPHCVDLINRTDLSRGRAGWTTSTKPPRRLPGSLTGGTKATCSRTPGCTRPSKR